VSEFRHYFWNTEVMGLDDWAKYLQLDSNKAKGTGRTSASQTAYQAALSCGADVALYRTGIRKELDIKKVLDDLMAELYHTFLEIKSLPLSQPKVEMLSSISRAILNVDERVQQGDSALQEVLKKFEKFRVITESSATPSLMDLAPTGSISGRSRVEIQASNPGEKK
jgi:hypothetical protein